MTERDDSTRHFGEKRARVYDTLIRQVVPGYDALHGMASLLLRREVAEDGRILVVGVGTGQEITAFGARNPGWRITAVEPAAEMLEVARARVRDLGLAGRVELVEGYCDDLPAEARFDAAALVLVMHFVPDDGSKQRLLDSISARLKPGAPLILADLHAEVGGARFERFMAAWRDWQLAAGMEPDKVEKGFQQVVTDISFVPEARIFELLRGAGFGDVEPFFGAYLFGGWIAWKR